MDINGAGDLDRFEAHVPEARLTRLTGDRVPVPYPVSGCWLAGKGADAWLGGPLRRGVFGQIAVHDAAAIVGQAHQPEEHPAGDRGHSEAIAGNGVFDGVVEHGPPGWGRWLADARTVVPHGRFDPLIAELTQFPDDTR
ncbi:MAG: hypothetical protein OEU26_18495 [Candidatus Tectomicrobia bacterium]|nr:hypothetical protein [Candidatus Tectomicrobia bacterium]